MIIYYKNIYKYKKIKYQYYVNKLSNIKNYLF